MGKDEIIGNYFINLSQVLLGKEDKKLTLGQWRILECFPTW
jgi:hypothetical protein